MQNNAKITANSHKYFRAYRTLAITSQRARTYNNPVLITCKLGLEPTSTEVIEILSSPGLAAQAANPQITFETHRLRWCSRIIVGPHRIAARAQGKKADRIQDEEDAYTRHDK